MDATLKRLASFALSGLMVAVVMTVGAQRSTAGVQAPGRETGTIKGHIRLMGKLPGNPIIRMGMDPKCAQINAGKRMIQEIVAAGLDGSLANVFVSLQGSFPQTPVPSKPVTINQRGCIYGPRVVGIRVGQTLEVRNDDDLLHNVHSLSARGNIFNISEPKAGMVQQLRLKDEEVMLQLKCDIHSWMTAYVGVVNHPYFAVSSTTGTFEIDNVPPGNRTVQAWHERYGPLTKTVRVTAGATTTVDFAYSGTERLRTGSVEKIEARGSPVARLVTTAP
jgi:plastocyanin